MATHEPGTRPERVLLLLAQHGGALRGRAIRFSDESEFRFESLEELSQWLTRTTRESGHPEVNLD